LKASGNPLLSKIAEGLFDLMSKLLEQYAYSDQRSRSVMKIHEELIRLLKAKEYDEVRDLLEVHIKESIPVSGQPSQGQAQARGNTSAGGRRRAP
jgi:DNA-binding FadR family transcriptional regulator